MTEETQRFVCPNGCDVSEEPWPFFYPPGCLMRGKDDGRPELGIFAEENGDLSNTWIDGTRGIAGWEDDGCLPHCVICYEESEHHAE